MTIIKRFALNARYYGSSFGVQMPYERTISSDPKALRDENSNWLLVPCVQLLFVLKIEYCYIPERADRRAHNHITYTMLFSIHRYTV